MIRGNQAVLADLYAAAVAGVEPGALVEHHFDVRDGVAVVISRQRTLARFDDGRVWLVAAGKAAASMATAVLRILGHRIAGGVVVAPSRARLQPPLRSFAGGHPLPTARSLAAGREAWKLAARARAGDTVLVLLSGGASSLLALPAHGITLGDKVRTTDLLLRAGARIGEINAVRKHLSRIKGGGLAQRAGRARVITLLISDVIGSSTAVIGSGPTAADPTTFADAWDVLCRHGLETEVPRAVRRRLERGRRGCLEETPKPGGVRALHLVVGDVGLALRCAAGRARLLGWRAEILTERLRGDTGGAARRLAGEALRRRRSRGLCLLAGGETASRVRGRGKGGRNQEFALAFAREIDGVPGITLLSAGSDGIDGPTDAGGAFADWGTIRRARRLGLDPGTFLARSDSYRFFARLGDLFRPGPTGTNVMDLKFVLLG